MAGDEGETLGPWGDAGPSRLLPTLMPGLGAGRRDTSFRSISFQCGQAHAPPINH